MKRGVVLLSTILALTSCRTTDSLIDIEKEIFTPEINLEQEIIVIQDDPETKRKKHWDALSKYTPLTPENKFNSDGTEKAPFDWVEGGLEEYIKKIYILKKEDFFHEYDWMVAHAHSDIGIICLPEDYDKKLVIHEAAHVRHGQLDKSTNFSIDWWNAAQVDYGSLIDVTNDDVAWKDNPEGPDHGHVRAYGNKSLYEDVATFVEVLGYKYTPLEVEVRIELDEDVEDYVRKCPLYFCDKNDRRYQEKIDLLFMYSFINYSEYLEISNNVGCLRHLMQD